MQQKNNLRKKSQGPQNKLSKFFFFNPIILAILIRFASLSQQYCSIKIDYLTPNTQCFTTGTPCNLSLDMIRAYLQWMEINIKCVPVGCSSDTALASWIQNVRIKFTSKFYLIWYSCEQKATIEMRLCDFKKFA